MQVWNVLHAARWKYRMQKWCKNCHLGTIAQLCRAISSQLRRVSTIGKNLLSSNISSTCSHNTANFGPLTAEIGWPVWGTSANFNWLRVLAALLHGIWASAKLCGIEQRAPPIFGRAAVTLGIGPHSSFHCFLVVQLLFGVVWCRPVGSAHTHCNVCKPVGRMQKTCLGRGGRVSLGWD